METKHTVKHVNDGDFEKQVLKGEKPVLVDFWAPWCGPCRAIGPVLESLADEYEGRVEIVKINIDDNPRTALRYGVRSIPTLILVKEGQVRETRVGMAPREELAALLDRHLNERNEAVA